MKETAKGSHQDRSTLPQATMQYYQQKFSRHNWFHYHEYIYRPWRIEARSTRRPQSSEIFEISNLIARSIRLQGEVVVNSSGRRARWIPSRYDYIESVCMIEASRTTSSSRIFYSWCSSHFRHPVRRINSRSQRSTGTCLHDRLYRTVVHASKPCFHLPFSHSHPIFVFH